MKSSSIDDDCWIEINFIHSNKLITLKNNNLKNNTVRYFMNFSRQKKN